MVSRGVSRAFHSVRALSRRFKRVASSVPSPKPSPRELSSLMRDGTAAASVAAVTDTSRGLDAPFISPIV